MGKRKSKIKSPIKPDKTEATKILYKCRDCGGGIRQTVETKQCIQLLGLKAKRCPKCQKMGTFLATGEIDGKERKWAVICINHDLKTKKEIVIDESSNSSKRIKKKIYGDLKPKELEVLRPYQGVNHVRNRGISAERMVDDSFQPVLPKWTKAFQRKHWEVFNETD